MRDRVTLWSAERANVFLLETHTHMHARIFTYRLVRVCACLCVNHDDHQPLISSYMLETISQSAPVVGQRQALRSIQT